MNAQSLDIDRVLAVTPSGPARSDSSRISAFPSSSQSVVPAPQSPSTDTADITDAVKMKRVVEELNQLFSNLHTDLRFSIEKDLGVIVVAVVDSRDGKVLRQIPSEDALRIARNIEKNLSGLIAAVA